MKNLEIHALEYVICKVIVFLNYLFRDELRDWVIDEDRINLLEVNKSASFARVLLKPGNWPEDTYMDCSFDKINSALVRKSIWHISKILMYRSGHKIFDISIDWESNQLFPRAILFLGDDLIKSIYNKYDRKVLNRLLIC